VCYRGTPYLFHQEISMDVPRLQNIVNGYEDKIDDEALKLFYKNLGFEAAKSKSSSVEDSFSFDDIPFRVSPRTSTGKNILI